LIAYASSLLGDPMSAEDVVQEVLHRALNVEALPTSFQAWLYTVTRNACLNRLRALGRRPDRDHLPSRGDLAASLTGHVTLLSRAERYAALAAALRHLSLDQEEAIRLRYTEGLSRADIAHVLGVPESTVKSRLFEGLQTLRRFMAQPKERD
jgi:RNA polymerase sigma-70 factor (ECF subfamily)